MKSTLNKTPPLGEALPLNEAETEFLESQIPAQARAATGAAHWNALTRGRSLVCARDGELIEIYPDGTVRVLETLAAGPTLPAGTEIVLR